MHRPRTASALLGPGQVLGQLLDSALDVGLKMLCSLVLRDRPEHLLETAETVLVVPGGSERLFGLLVVGA